MSNRKYMKAFKGRMSGKAGSRTTVAFGQYGLKVLDHARITANQLESVRKAIMFFFKRDCKVWNRAIVDVPVSRKPAEVRMGRGKGSTEFKIARVYPGTIIFELDGVEREAAKTVFAKVGSKLPVKVAFVEKNVI